jgi:hypothetical protein
MSYYENQRSKVNIMVELEKRGWNIFGFKEDQSDSMTDYWSPAHWSGIAEKDGFVLLVDVYGMSDSGKEIVKRGYDIDHAKVNKLQTLANDSAASVGERENCLRKIEEMKQKAKDSEIVICKYPVYKNSNPKRNNWHIEKDGEIIAKGNGAFKCAQWDETERKEAVTAFVDRIEKAIDKGKKLETKTVEVTETEIQAVVTENGKLENGQIISLNTNFNYGNSKGVYQLYRAGQSVLYFGRMNKKLNKMMSTNTRGNQCVFTVEQFNKFLEKGSISFVELKEVEVIKEKVVFVENNRVDEQEEQNEKLQLEANEKAEEDNKQYTTSKQQGKGYFVKVFNLKDLYNDVRTLGYTWYKLESCLYKKADTIEQVAQMVDEIEAIENGHTLTIKILDREDGSEVAANVFFGEESEYMGEMELDNEEYIETCETEEELQEEQYSNVVSFLQKTAEKESMNKTGQTARNTIGEEILVLLHDILSKEDFNSLIETVTNLASHVSPVTIEEVLSNARIQQGRK